MVRTWYPHLPDLDFEFLESQPPREWYNTLMLCNPSDSTHHFYNLKANTWRMLEFQDPLGTKREAAMAIIGQDLYRSGGVDQDIISTNEMSCLNLQTREFKILSPMLEARFCHSLVALTDGSLLAAGGSNVVDDSKTVEIYNVQNNQWEYTAPMNEVRLLAGSALLDGMVFVAGGFHHVYDGDEEELVLDTFECYNTETNTWANLPSMKRRRYGFQLVAADGQLYALGGTDGHNSISSCERFCVGTNQWYDLPDMMIRVSNFGAAVVDSKIVLAGRMSCVQCFDLCNQTWSQFPPSSYVVGEFMFFLPGINITHPDLHAPQFDELPHGAVIVYPTKHDD